MTRYCAKRGYVCEPWAQQQPDGALACTYGAWCADQRDEPDVEEERDARRRAALKADRDRQAPPPRPFSAEELAGEERRIVDEGVRRLAARESARLAEEERARLAEERARLAEERHRARDETIDRIARGLEAMPRLGHLTDGSRADFVNRVEARRAELAKVEADRQLAAEQRARLAHLRKRVEKAAADE